MTGWRETPNVWRTTKNQIRLPTNIWPRREYRGDGRGMNWLYWDREGESAGDAGTERVNRLVLLGQKG